METVTEILIDFSGSMKDKLPLMQQVLLTDVVPNLDYASRIGIKTFAGNKNQPPTTQILNLNLTNKDEIIRAINTLGTPAGHTPITAAIRASVTTLKEYAANDKKIILVTDGKEDTGGDYVAEAKKASVEGINCQVHIIGIGLNETAKAQAQEISKITNGSFSFIPYTTGASYNSAIIKTNLIPFINAVKVTPIVQSEIKPQPIKVEEPEVEIEKPIEKEQTNSDNSEALKLIIEEIKGIKEQLKKMKSEKNAIPEIIEDVEHNEKIRKASEEYLFGVLKRKYPDRVKWLNDKGESNADHDFEILDLDSGTIEYYIECKGTVKNKPTFYLTKNEWRLFLNHTKNYQIYFVKNSFGKPSHTFIDNLFDWLLKGKLVPYLKERDIIKEERVFLTLNEITFDD
ncbi:MAG: DUF3883 domain-containing protein [Bacteroidales bacterium]|jgi:hypothetical protein|nr:DUF3883 domain-containing protein [Bacteroidales bacterium]